MRSRFDRELDTLDEMIIEMCMYVKSALEKAVSLITVRDTSVANEVYALEEEIDGMEVKIQNHCLRLLIAQQPVARDLRRISSALKMITDLERIGDQSEDITDICMGFETDVDAKLIEDVVKMGENTVQIVKDTIKAFVNTDVELAKRIRRDDDIVDDYFEAIRNELIEEIKKDDVEPIIILDVLMISRHFERAADHSVNISEWIIFKVEG